MRSEVSTRFIKALVIHLSEESYFENGKPAYSSFTRIVTDKETVSKETRLEEQVYHLYTEGREDKPPIKEKIQYNIIKLYFLEPTSRQKVYSDAYQQWVYPEKTSMGHYKLVFTDKNFNEYIYQNGVCTSAILHHKLYKLEFLLTVKKNVYAGRIY